MVIISIVGSVAILTISHNQNTRFETLAKQLTNLLTLAEEQAMLQPATLKLDITKNAFQFYQYQDATATTKATWQAITDTTLGTHPIPSDTQMTLHTTENKSPQIIISTSGDITPFTLFIGKTHEKPRYKVIGEANGTIYYEKN